MERVIGKFKNDGLLHLQFWEDEYNHNISDFAVPEVDAKKLYYELRDYFKQRVETAMHKKEEQSKAYIKPIILDRNKKYLKEDNWELGLEYTDFTGYEIQCAFETGYDAGKQEIEHIVWQVATANYEKGKKEFIDKACEWLKENSGYYVEHWDDDTWINSKLYEDFRKVMEEEQHE